MAANPVHISMLDRTSERGDARPETEIDLDTMREEVERLAGQVREVVELRSRQAARAAEAGTVALRGSIRRNPWLALAAAGTTGVLLALAVTRPSPRTRLARRMGPISAYVPDRLEDALDRAHRSIAGNSMATRIEQLVDAISRIDPAAMTHPLAEAASRLLKTWRG